VYPEQAIRLAPEGNDCVPGYLYIRSRISGEIQVD
jgi:hypothetical protein